MIGKVVEVRFHAIGQAVGAADHGAMGLFRRLFDGCQFFQILQPQLFHPFQRRIA